MGDFDVKLKRKVHLRKKLEEFQPPLETAPPHKSNKWIWWIVALIVLCVIAYFVFYKSRSEQPAQTETEVVEEVVVADSDDNADSQTEVVQDEAIDEEAPKADQTEQSVDESKPEANATVTNTSTQEPQSNYVESTSVTNDLEAEARKVIRGDYGIGEERKAKLGSKYQPIQNRVNELKREGVF